jgi:hypothetical protein
MIYQAVQILTQQLIAVVVVVVSYCLVGRNIIIVHQKRAEMMFQLFTKQYTCVLQE